MIDNRLFIETMVWGVLGSLSLITALTCAAYFLCQTEFFANLLFGNDDTFEVKKR